MYKLNKTRGFLYLGSIIKKDLSIWEDDDSTLLKAGNIKKNPHLLPYSLAC